MRDWASIAKPMALGAASSDATLAVPVPPRTRIHRLGAMVVRAIMAEQTLALLDQAVVSGASFVTTVLIGRYTGASELGTYALAASVLIWLTNAQEAFISLPYTLHQDRSPNSIKARAGHALAFCAALSVLAVVAITVADLFIEDSGGHSHFITIMWSLAAVAPFVIHRDFARRHAFADGRNIEPLVLDAAIACLQIGILFWLAWMDMLSAVTALGALGMACAFAVLGWFWTTKHRFRFGYQGMLTTLRESWGVGKWLFFNQFLAALQSQITLWTLALVLGTRATGIYIACYSVALFTNPFIIGLSNMLWGKAARTFQEGGSARLLRASIIDTAFLGTILSAFCLFILALGETVLKFLFPGGEYDGYHHIVTLLAFSQLACGLGMPPSSALAGMGFIRTNSAMAVGETAVTALLAFPAISSWGLTGAASAVLAVAVLRIVGRWTAFIIIARRDSSGASVATDTAAVSDLLSGVRKSTGGWTINALNLPGCQAHVFSAEPDTGRGSGTDRLIVKMYRKAIDAAEVQDQYDALRRLHAILDQRRMGDWTIRIPEPLVFSSEPLTLAMTAVPGQKLSTWLAESDVSLDEVDSIAEVTAQLMLMTWPAGLSHGDLTIENILCDVSARIVSFVDAGPKAECAPHWYTGGCWNLAVHDVAHLLAHEGETVLAAWARPRLRRRRRRFIEQFLRLVLATHRKEVRFDFLVDVACCTRAHVTPAQRFYGLYSTWLVLKRRIALWRVGAILDRMKSECLTDADMPLGVLPRASQRGAGPSTAENRRTAMTQGGHRGSIKLSDARSITPWGVDPIPSRMPKRGIATRIAGRVLRSIKAAFGIDSFLQTEDRRIFENVIIPYFLSTSEFDNIVFVGCDWYTRGYTAWFQNKTYSTIETDPSKRKYGAPRHIVGGLQDIEQYFPPGTVDAILCNGVFGWGLDLPADVEKAISGSHAVLRPGGLLVIGVDGVDDHRPYALERCHALRAFEAFVFPPLSSADYLTDTPYRHRFIFLQKPVRD